ncbi:GTP-binding protein [Acetobacter sp. LMG 32666]|uniref:AAA family ATPase n=1 Tax=Acetobacter sp. LMG 32666 TaxID=2959295 RepID=UPI0030C7C6F4
MILTDLQIEAVRRFASPIRVEGLGAGLNVLAAPNEAGKSTVLKALRAALTLRHGSKAKPFQDLLPYGGGSPHVGVGFTWRGQPCWLEKKFGSGSLARLDLGAERFDGDAAEERLQDLFELEKINKYEAAGLWNALLVEQGESFAQPPLQGAGRASLQACLQQSIQGVTGTAEASAMLALVNKRLAQYQTATGKVSQRMRQVQEASEQAHALVATLVARREALHEDINGLEQTRRMLAESENPEQRRQAEEKLIALRQKRDLLLGLATQEQAAQAQLNATEQNLQYFQAEQERRQTRRADIARLEQALAEARVGQSELERLAQDVDQKLVQAQAGLGAASTRHQQARTTLSRVMQKAEQAQTQQALAQERAAFERANAACARLEKAQAALRVLPVDAAFMRRLAKAVQGVHQAQARMQAQATRFVATLQPDAAGTVWLNGQPCPLGPQSLTDVSELVVDGVGRFTITPPTQQSEALHTALATAQTALDDLLREVGCHSADQAESQHEAHRQAERAVEQASAECMALLGVAQASLIGGALDQQRQKLREREAHFAKAQAAQANAPEEDAQPLDVEQARRQEQDALTAVEVARQQEQEVLSQHRAAHARLEQIRAQTEQQQQTLQRDQRELSVWVERDPDAALLARTSQSEQDRQHAQVELARIAHIRQQEEPLAVVEQGITRREQDMEHVHAQVKRLSMDKMERETRIRQAEGDGLDEQLASAERHAGQLQGELAAWERERAALALLESTLLKAETTQTERYLAPLVQAMQPAFSALFRGVTLEVDTQFALTGLTRQRAEDIKDLSDGTREQIAVLVRLGFAELLHKRGAPAILVLDDALSFSDSQRLETLFDVLSDAATRLQIILLTCHAEQFTPLRGNMLSLRPMERFEAPR